MEYIVAALIVVAAVTYAVFLAVNIEKGKTWALEIARAISMLDPQSVNHHMRERAMEAPVEQAVEVEPEEIPDRLAA